MSINHPDVWQLVKIEGPNSVTYRVLAGWYGGYAGSDEWKLSSGVVSIDRDGDVIDFHNASGSIYKCNVNSQRFSSLTHSVFMSYTKLSEESPESEIKLEIIEDIEQICNLVFK